jgi:hypothetical protein
MEDIAKALDAPLPLLLESTDLDKDTLDALAGGKAPRACLPVSSEWRPCYRASGVHRQEVGRGRPQEAPEG